MDKPQLEYEDFCQILGRVSLDSYLRFEEFSKQYQRQMKSLQQALSAKESENTELKAEIEVLQANLDLARKP